MNPPAASAHLAGLREAGIEAGPAALLASYLDLLALWAPRVNLTGARSAAERVDLLVTSVLPATRMVEPGVLIDVGSGNGSPGLVLAALRSDVRAVLLEPRQHRWAFLKEASRLFPAGRVDVVRTRHDAYRGSVASTVAMRAVSLPLSALLPLLAPAGCAVVLGREPAPDPGFRLDGVAETPHGAIRRYVRVPRGTPGAR